MTLKPEDRALIEEWHGAITVRHLEAGGRVMWELEDVAALLAAAREEARPDPRPSPVGREEVARIIDPVAFKSWENMRAHCLAKGDDEQEASATADWGHKSAMDAARAKADAILALFSPADGWRPIETAPKDGTLILACQRPDEGHVWFKAWEQWKGPQTIAWRGYHVNAPGKETWRDAKGSPVLPDLWMPLDALAAPPPPGGQG